MKKILVGLVVLASMAGAGLAVGGGSQEASFSEHGAIVMNFGNGQGGRLGCAPLSCGGTPCTEGGSASFHITPSGQAGFACNGAMWLLGVPKGGLFFDVNCGLFGNGKGRVAPSRVVNYACHT